jgi:hypothetical protein
MESKICKTCQVEKTLPEFKPHRRVCRKCDSKMNYEKYKDLFKEYYVKDQIKRLEYQKVYRKKISEGKPKLKVGRPRTVNVDPSEKEDE